MEILGEFQKLEYVDRLNTTIPYYSLQTFWGVEIPRFSRSIWVSSYLRCHGAKVGKVGNVF